MSIRYFAYLSLMVTLSMGLLTQAPEHSVHAASLVEDIQQKIQTRTADIEKLQQEIANYQKQLNGVLAQKQSLQQQINVLELTRKKLAADIQLTEENIGLKENEIALLENNISGTQQDITDNRGAIRESLAEMYREDSESMMETVLSNQTLGASWDRLEQIVRFQTGVRESIARLGTLKTNLEENRELVMEEKVELQSYREKLADQKLVAESTLRQQNSLLAQTKNKESEYNKLLAEKQAQQKAFERELATLESELRYAVDPSRLPPAGSGVLAWPLKSVSITQYFGNTDFAKSGAYNGSGHNGVDFRASLGTEIYAAGSGTVIGVGNTDAVKGCYSFGKWVMVQHPNGLSSLYAHLDLVKVTEGQRIVVGDLVGYSGNTGYSTGPHLHFGVYATQGTRIVRMGDVRPGTACANARVPIASYNAYLDPLQYL